MSEKIEVGCPCKFRIDKDLTADDVVRNMMKRLARRHRIVSSFEFECDFWGRIQRLCKFNMSHCIAICRHYGYDPYTGKEIGESE